MAKKEKAPNGAKMPLYKKWWFWVIVVVLVGAAGSGLSGGGESGGGEPSTGQQESVETQAPAPVAEPSETETPEAPAENIPDADPDSYVVPLGNSNVTIKRHEVRSGSGAAILDIGVGETTAAQMDAISSDELSAFVAALDFDRFGCNNIVISFDDGTGLVFQKGLSSFSADYGYIDVGPGNFEITERLGAIWNEGEGWYYMTVEEMEAEDAAG